MKGSRYGARRRRCCCVTVDLADARARDQSRPFYRVGIPFTGEPSETERPTIEHTGPVWVVSTCGADRDCVPDQRWQDSIQTARNGAASWIVRDQGRRVDIYTEPGGAWLEGYQ